MDRYFLGTVTDHVAPWKSVYKIHRLNGGDVTFALTTGGHNAGIVSGPVHPRRKHQVHTAGAVTTTWTPRPGRPRCQWRTAPGGRCGSTG